MRPKHIIKKQVIEMHMPANVDNVALRNRASEIYHQRIIGIIDGCLDARNENGVSEKIDFLELDLGEISMKFFEQEMVEKVYSVLNEKLSFLPTPLFLVNDQQQEEINKSGLALIQYFLSTGSMPWWAQEVTFTYLQETMLNELNRNEANTSVQITRLIKTGVSFKRFINTFSDEVLSRFAVYFLAIEQQTLNDLRSEIKVLLPNTRQSRNSFWKWILELCLGRTTKSLSDPLEIVQSLINVSPLQGATGLLTQNNRLLSSLNSAFKLQLAVIDTYNLERLQTLAASLLVPANQPAIGSPVPELAELQQQLDALIASIKKSGFIATKPVLQLVSQLIVLLHDVSKATVQQAWRSVAEHSRQAQVVVQQLADVNLLRSRKSITTKSPVARAKTKSMPDAEDQTEDVFSESDKVYVANSGLVLLWPFLTRFFENIGLVKANKFTSEEAQHRACLVLEYLATGQGENTFEANLPLNKILCGVDVHESVDTQWLITDEEQGHCDNLLHAVIANNPLWTGLSIAGLRQSYLIREGAVSGRDGNWLLQVKRETYDVLLDKLPWTLQFVKLPWMQNLVVVDWQLL